MVKTGAKPRDAPERKSLPAPAPAAAATAAGGKKAPTPAPKPDWITSTLGLHVSDYVSVP